MTLTNQEIADLFNLMKKGNQNARHTLINSIRMLAFQLANSFHKTHLHIPLDELQSEALLLSVKSVDKFDINRTNCLTTFATRYIQSQLITFVSKNSNYSRVVNHPAYLAKIIRIIKKLNTVDINEIHEKTGLKKRLINNALSAMSFSAKPTMDVYETSVADDVEEESIVTLCLADLIELASEKLSGVDRDIYLDYLKDEDTNKVKTKYNIAAKYGKTYAEVTTILSDSKKHLKNSLKQKGKKRASRNNQLQV